MCYFDLKKTTISSKPTGNQLGSISMSTVIPEGQWSGFDENTNSHRLSIELIQRLAPSIDRLVWNYRNDKRIKCSELMRETTKQQND